MNHQLKSVHPNRGSFPEPRKAGTRAGIKCVILKILKLGFFLIQFVGLCGRPRMCAGMPMVGVRI